MWQSPHIFENSGVYNIIILRYFLLSDGGVQILLCSSGHEQSFSFRATCNFVNVCKFVTNFAFSKLNFYTFGNRKLSGHAL